MGQAEIWSRYMTCNCLDNATAENFFGIMKSELLYAEKFESPEAFIKTLDEYIEYL